MNNSVNLIIMQDQIPKQKAGERRVLIISILPVFLLIFSLFSFSFQKQAHYNISDYGALADTSVVNTRVIQQVIDKCAAEGGGIVIVPFQNVIFENCNITAETGFVLENVKGLDLSGLNLTVKEGEKIIRRNAE